MADECIDFTTIFRVAYGKTNFCTSVCSKRSRNNASILNFHIFSGGKGNLVGRNLKSPVVFKSDGILVFNVTLKKLP